MRGYPSNRSSRSNLFLSISYRSRFQYLTQLSLERLEDRRMLSTLMVDTDAAPGGDGLTWSSAFNDLQNALVQTEVFNTDSNETNDIDQIWIAEGTYQPSALIESGDPRSASFSLIDGVTLFGGFDGSESLLEDRDWSIHITRLSGDLGIIDDRSDNAYTVVYCGEGVEATLDGLSISDGNADGSDSTSHLARNRGGGIYGYYCTLSVTNSTLSDNTASADGGSIYCTGALTVVNSMLLNNSADSGGGIYCMGSLKATDSSLTGNSAEYHGGGIYIYGVLAVKYSTLSNNSASSSGGGIYCSGVQEIYSSMLMSNQAGAGGGIYNNRDSVAVLHDSTISNNIASASGGGIFNKDGGTATVIDSTITNNSASSCGGGIYNTDNGTTTATSSTITDNMADYGGGIFNAEDGSVSVLDTAISGNSASHSGGGIYNSGTSAVLNSTLSYNLASCDGGGILSSGTLTVTNSTLASNLASCDGGGIINTGAISVTNSTLFDNSAGISGGGLFFVESPSVSILNNTIVAGNHAALGADLLQSSPMFPGFYNLIGDGSDQWALINGSNGNQVGSSSSPIDPMLSDWTQFDNGLWGYCLLPGSPALDAGDNTLAVNSEGFPLNKDLAGKDRIQNGTVDMGAVEGATAGSPAQTYMVTSLAETINNDGILTFLEAFEAASRNQSVGDAPAGSCTQQDTIQFADGLSGTVLVNQGALILFGDLSIKGPGTELLCFQADGHNRIFIVRAGVSVVLDGIAISGGMADVGGGIYNAGTLMVLNSVLSDNLASDDGGGIFNTGILTVTNSSLIGNSASSNGGGIDSSGILTANSLTISNNLASAGGGIFNDDGIATIVNSTIAYNSTYDGTGSANSGGGIYSTGTLMVTSSALLGNLSIERGGGISNCNAGNVTIIDSIISDNTAINEGGGIYNTRTLTVTNCILSNNSSSEMRGGGIHNLAGTIIFENSSLVNNWTFAI